MSEREHIITLQSVGLTLKEARAYLALLELHRGSAAAVAKKSGLKASTAYVVLKDLINKGFVHRIPRAKKQLFVAEPPDGALLAMEGRTSDFRSIVPELAALSKTTESVKSKTLFFESEAGMRNCYDYRRKDLKNCEYAAYFASAEDITPAMSEVLLEWSAAMAKANVSSRAIVPDHPSLVFWRKKDKEFKREVKVVPPKSYSARSSVEIFPDFVRIVMYKNMQGIIIDDAEVAESFRQIFEMVWAGA